MDSVLKNLKDQRISQYNYEPKKLVSLGTLNFNAAEAYTGVQDIQMQSEF